ncbi:MAG: DNA repair protein RecO [Patescibacteria group bacterium]
MTYLTQAIVLKKCALGDYDCQYTLYTRLFGKVTAIAKGAKKITSKLNSHLEPFLICDLMLAEGQLSKRLAAAGIAKNYSAIKADLDKIVIANYFLAAIDSLIIHEAADGFLFEIIEKFLFSLSEEKEKTKNLLSLNKYLFELLRHLGYRPKIQAQTQKQLFFELKRLIEVVSEKPARGCGFVERLF